MGLWVCGQDACARCDVDKSEVARALSEAGLMGGEETATVVLRPHTVRR